MESNNPEVTNIENVPQLDNGTSTAKQKWTIFGIIVGILAIIALVVFSIIFLLNPSTDTGRFRDIFIIFMAVEFLFIGLVLIVMVVQLARLINLLQNEVKPILDSTNETVSTLRGTTRFLSDNLTEPIIKLNEYLAGIVHITRIIKPKRTKKD